LHICTPGRWALLLALAISLSACGPQGSHGGHGVGHLFGMRRGFGLATHAVRLGMRANRPQGFRRACADDVARLCQSAKTKRDERECLKGKEDSLSAACKAALDRRRQPER
jgi:hypothetical protein